MLKWLNADLFVGDNSGDGVQICLYHRLNLLFFYLLRLPAKSIRQLLYTGVSFQYECRQFGSINFARCDLTNLEVIIIWKFWSVMSRDSPPVPDIVPNIY